eukprot:CAMPEP_0178438786 /NCGR_PEP_ID=MMETSP0689_2-20121128/35786_1 /TAXON_ID=160604 /ORGANISM="Amphidinium massartii, Strain CS-259" /LENGTH=135 /DNA_ID=CAMNT_0020061227 /DNA_START=1 /DNA_END=408 /DNA_ORIENTATION=-
MWIGLTSLFTKIANHGATEGGEAANSQTNQDLLNRINTGQYQATMVQEPFQAGPGQTVGGVQPQLSPEEVRQARLARLEQSSAGQPGASTPSAAADATSSAQPAPATAVSTSQESGNSTRRSDSEERREAPVPNR